MKIAFAGTGYINKIHARAAQNCGAELVAVVNHKPESMVQFAANFGIPHQYETVEAMLANGGVDALGQVAAVALMQRNSGVFADSFSVS